MKFIIKKSAYTLSEVLITLSLIGFLATMTLATIGSSVQQRARLAEFRTAYAKLDNSLRSTIDETGRIMQCYDSDGSAWTDFGLNLSAGTPSPQMTECANLTSIMARNMGAIKTCPAGQSAQCLPLNYPTLNAVWQNYTNSPVYILENGMIFITMRPDSTFGIAMDVNGRKGPNRWGLDIFPFVIAIKETKRVNGALQVINVGIMPPRSANDNVSNGQLKSTAQLMKDSANNPN